MLPIEFTVAIRVYNAAERLPLLLENLRSQHHTESIRWEILIVDNNSTDNTAALIQTYQAQIPHLRYVLEPEQGAAIARKRAIAEAQGTWIGFLDDDTLPTSDWVIQAYQFAQTHPNAGAFGSRILPEYEVEPPQDFHRIAHYLPTKLDTRSFRYASHHQGMPVGAGLVIHKQAWLESAIGNQIIQGPVKGGFALKGEETEVLWKMRTTPWEIWYNADMTILHKIPRWRLEKAYLLNFLKVIGLSQHRFRMLRYPTWKRPIVFPLLLLNDLRKVVLAGYKHHRSQHFIDACDLQFYLGRLFSPFYIWKLILLQKIEPSQTRSKRTFKQSENSLHLQ